MTLTILEVLGKYSIDCPSTEVGLIFLLMIRLAVTGFGEEITQVQCHSHHIISKVHTVSMNFSLLMFFDYLARVGYVRVFHCKILFPNGTLWKEVTLCNPHLGSGELCPTF